MAEDDDKREDEDGGDAEPSTDEAGADAAAEAKAAAKARVIAEAEAKAKAKAADGESTALARTTDKAQADSKSDSKSDSKADDDAAERRDLPKWNRARVKRKAPAGEDKDAFQTTVRKAGRSALTRAPMLLALAALVAGGIGGYIWWSNEREADVAEQTKLLSVAAAYQARGVVDPTIEVVMAERARPLPEPVAKDEADLAQKIDTALEGLASTHPDSPANHLADLLRGARAMRAGAFADAEAAYAAFLEGRAQHELAFLAQEGILLAKEAQGDVDGALAQADVLAGEAPGAFYRDQALWHKGRMLEAAGRTEDAKAVFRQYAEEYPLAEGSFAQQQVIERLRELDPEAVADLPPEPTGLGGGLPPGIMPP